MPAYPMAPALTLDEFIEYATNHWGAKLRRPKGMVTGPSGKKVTIRILERKEDERVWQAVIPPIAGDKHLLPDVLRSLCANLGKDPVEFGLILG